MKIDKFLAHLKNLDIKICVHKNQIQYDAPKGVLTNEIHEAIRKRKYEIINFLNKGSTGTISKKQVITPAPHQDKYPLSFAQQRLWFLHKLEPENPFYNFPRALRLKGDLRVEVLRKAVRALLKRHTSLRTTFIVEEGTPYQVITKKTSIDIPLIDLTKTPQDKREKEAKKLAYEEAHKPFDLSKDLPTLLMTTSFSSPFITSHLMDGVMVFSGESLLLSIMLF